MALDRQTSQTGITATAGGGQANAVPLREQGINKVNTVATAADSVRLPQAIAGKSLDGVNAAAANAMNLYPDPGSTINALAADAALSIVAGKSFRAVCPEDGKWYVNLSA